ncbi:MAG TPA: hypothetical protein VMD09_01840 [Solirubrobacteraceae bacterium]|nr:hypothetical protein [Solirubrobacteraceae bacterium]
MFQLHPTVLDALVEDRVAELRQTAALSARAETAKHRRRPVQSARHGAGWLLVDVGLRLALPHPASRER